MQSYDEVTSKFNKYLSSGQKKALQKRANALSMQNSVARQNVVTDAYKGLKQQNEYLSAMGLAANLQSAPSSGADEVARRMPEMRQELRKLDAAEQGALTPVGAQMAQDTINAQLAAQRHDNGMYRISDGNGGFVKNADGTDMWVSKKDKYSIEHGGKVTDANRYSHDRVKGYQLAASSMKNRSVFEVSNKFTAAGQQPSVLQDLRDKLTNAPKQNMTNAVAAAANRNETNSIIKSKLGNIAGNFTNAINKVFGTVLNKTQENAIAQQAGIQNIISSFSKNGIITQQAADALAKSVADGSVNLDDVKQQLFERLTIDFGIKTENSANAAMGNVTGGFVSTAAQQVIDGFMIAAESGKTADYDNVVNLYCDYIKEQSDANLQLFDGMLAQYYKAGMQRPELDAARAAFTSGNTELAYNYLNNFENMTQGEAILQAVNAAAGVPSGDPNFTYFPAGEPVISPEQAEDIKRLVDQGRYDEAIDVFNSDAEAYYVKRSDELWSERHEDIHQFYKMPVDEANLDEFYTKNPLVFELDKLYTLAKSAQSAEAWDMYGVAYKNLYNHKADQDRLEAQYGVTILEKVYGMSEDDSAKVMAAWDRMYNEGDLATYEQALADATFSGGIIGYEALMLRNAQLASIGVRFQDYYKYEGMTNEQIQHMIDVLKPAERIPNPKPEMTGDPLIDSAALTEWQAKEHAAERQADPLQKELEGVLRVRRIDERTEDIVRLRELDDTALATYETDLTDRMSSLLNEINPYGDHTTFNAAKMSPQRLQNIGIMLTGADKVAFDDMVDEWLLVGSIKTERQQKTKAQKHAEMISGIQAKEDYVQWSTYGKNRLYTKEDIAEKEFTPTGDPLIDAAAQTMNLVSLHQAQSNEKVYELQKALHMSDEEYYAEYGQKAERTGGTWMDVYRYMDDNEKGCFYYLMHESPAAANEFLEFELPYCRERQAKAEIKEAQEVAEIHPLLSHLITYANAIPANYASLAYIASSAISGEYDPYSEWNALNLWNSTVRETHYADVTTWLDDKGKGDLSGLANFVMGGLDSWIDSLVNAGFTANVMGIAGANMSQKAANFVGEAAGLVGFGANAYTSTMRDLDAKGIGIEDSRKVATAAAFFEMFFEKIGLENILNGSKDWAKSGIWNTVKSAIIEASEEGNTTIGNIVADSMILGNQSNWADDYNAFRDAGNSVSAAGALASLESIKSVALDAAGGAFSGGLSGVVNTARMKAQQAATGAAINAAGRSTAVMDAAQNAIDNGTATPALQKLMHTVAEAYAKSNTIANTDLGKLNFLLAVSDMEQAEGAIDKLEDEGSLTSKEAAAARDAFEQAYDSVSRLEDSAVYGFNQQQIDEMFKDFSEDKRKLIFGAVNENTKGRAQYHAGMNEQRIKQLAESRVGEDITGDERKKAVADEVEAIKREQEWQRVERVKKAAGYQSVEVDDNIVNAMPTIATENYDGVEVRLHKYQSTEQMGYMNKLRLDFVRAMSKASGVSVVVHDTLPVNGALESNGVMHISLDAQGVGSAIGHELTHFIRQNVTGDEWQNFVKFIKETANKRDKHGFERLAERNMQKYAKVMENLSEAQKTALVEEETICGLCEDVLKDDVRMQEFFEESPTLFGKVCAWLDRVVKHFKEIVGDKSYNARLMQNDIEELRDKWFAAFKVATKNAADKKVQKAAETGYAEDLGGVWMYSMKDDEYMQMAETYVRSKEEAKHYRGLANELGARNNDIIQNSPIWKRTEELKVERDKVSGEFTALMKEVGNAADAVRSSEKYVTAFRKWNNITWEALQEASEAQDKFGADSAEYDAAHEKYSQASAKMQAELEDIMSDDERLQELWAKEDELRENLKALEEEIKKTGQDAIDYYDEEMEKNDIEADKFRDAAETLEHTANALEDALNDAVAVAAEERGYKWDIYHGTSALFNEFDDDFEQYGLYGKGIYTTEDDSVANSYTSKEGGKDERTIHGFVKSPTEVDMNALLTTSVSELIQHGLDASKVLLLTDKIDDRAKEAFDKLPQIVNEYEIEFHDKLSKYFSDEDIKSLFNFTKDFVTMSKFNLDNMFDVIYNLFDGEDIATGYEFYSNGWAGGQHKMTENEAKIVKEVFDFKNSEDYTNLYDDISAFITDNYLEENDALVNNGFYLDDFLNGVAQALTNDNVFRLMERQFMESDLFSYSDYMSKDDASVDGKNEAQRKLYNKMHDKGTFIKEMYKAAGYTGITHVGGYSMGNGHLHQVHIAFDAPQIKYADAITKNSNGEIVPLSQRFDETSPDMRFSVKDDEHYANAKKFGFKEDMRRIIDKAAMAAGAYSKDGKTPQRFYHGTPSFGYTQYNAGRNFSWMYLAERIEDADTYAGKYNHKYGRTEPKEIASVKKASADMTQNKLKEVYESNTGKKFPYTKVTAKDREQLKDKLVRYAEEVRNDLLKSRKKEVVELREDAVATLDKIIAGTITFEEFKQEALTLEAAMNKSDSFIYYDMIEGHLDKYLHAEFKAKDRYGTYYYSKNEVVDHINYERISGIYETYMFAGEKPIEIDCQGHEWDSIQYEGKTTSTDSLCSRFFKQGYTAIHFKNVRDSYNSGSGREASRGGLQGADEWAVKNPNEQVKSADVETYDDSGKLLMPSERFDLSNPDMRFSLKNDLGGSEQYKLDVEHYNSALKTWTLLQDTLKEAEAGGDAGEIAQAQAAVTKQLDELSKYVIDAGEQRGYTQLVFHGTSAKFDTFNPDYEKFGLFGKGVYTTESEDVANSYQTKEKGSDNRTLKMLARIGNEIDMDAGATVSLRETLQAIVDNVDEVIAKTLTSDEDKENYRKDSIAADAERLVEPIGEFEDALITEMPITYDGDVFGRETHEKACELFKHMNKAYNGISEVPVSISNYKGYIEIVRGLEGNTFREEDTKRFVRTLGWMVELRKMAALGDKQSAEEYERLKQKYTAEYRSRFSNVAPKVWQLSDGDIDFWEHILENGQTFNAMNQKAREAAYAKYKELYGFKEYGYDPQLKLLEYMMDTAAFAGGINTNEDVYDIVMQVLKHSDATGMSHGRNRYAKSGKYKDLINLSNDSGTILKAAWSRMGYTGITHTGGLRMGNGNEHRVHIFFNAQQDLKYADPITYYKNGKPIKLDKRFDDTKTGSETLKFSLKDFERRDNDFLEAFRTGNKVLLHKINIEAAMAAGAWSSDGQTPTVVYHGSKSFGFHQWDENTAKIVGGYRHAYVTEDLEVAMDYLPDKGNKFVRNPTEIPQEIPKTMEGVLAALRYEFGDDYTLDEGATYEQAKSILSKKMQQGIYQFYVFPKNAVGYGAREIDAKGRSWESVPYTYHDYDDDMDYTEFNTTDELAFTMFERGFTAVHFVNVDDGANKSSSEWCLDSQNTQLKYAYDVVFDDNGEPIPPSKRYNLKEKAWMYSLKEDRNEKKPASKLGSKAWLGALGKMQNLLYKDERKIFESMPTKDGCVVGNIYQFVKVNGEDYSANFKEDGLAEARDKRILQSETWTKIIRDAAAASLVGDSMSEENIPSRTELDNYIKQAKKLGFDKPVVKLITTSATTGEVLDRQTVFVDAKRMKAMLEVFGDDCMIHVEAKGKPVYFESSTGDELEGVLCPVVISDDSIAYKVYSTLYEGVEYEDLEDDISEANKRFQKAVKKQKEIEEVSKKMLAAAEKTMAEKAKKAKAETAPVENKTEPAAVPETETTEQVPVTESTEIKEESTEIKEESAETSKETQKEANAKWRKEAMQDFRNEQKKELTDAEKKAAADRKAAEKKVEKLRKEKGQLVSRDGILMTPEQAADYDREKAEAKKKIGEQRRKEAYATHLENEAFRTQREELAKSGIILMTPEEAAAERDRINTERETTLDRLDAERDAAQFADEWEERTTETVTEDSDAAEKAWEDYIKATYGGLYKTKEEAYAAMTADLKKQQEEEDRYAAEVRAARFHVNDGTRTAPHITEQIKGMDDTPVLYEAQRITEKTPDENGEVKLIPKVIRDIVKAAKASNFLGLKDYSRVMDKVSGKNREIREALSTILEKPFLEAGYRYTHNLPAVRANYMDSMKELGVTGENYEKYSAAMQHYGEGYIVVDGEKVDYTLNDLKKDCPENWQQVKKAAEITRDLYDDYVDRINTMLEGIYPDVIEHAYTDKKRLDALVEEEENKAKAYRERAGVVYEQLEKAKARAAKAKHGTDAWAKANASVAMYERRLENVKLIAAKHEGRAAVRRAQEQQITQALATGDELRNKRLIRRADYMHHTMKEESQGFVERVKNAWTGTAGEIPPELVAKTDTTKPKTGHAKFMDKRRGIDSKADAVGSMLSYIEQAERKLAYDPFIAHLSYIERLVEEAAQDEYEATGAVNANDFKRFIHEWRNDIAGKSNALDRAFSDSNVLPRNLYETLQALGGRANANAVLFNFGSAAVQASNIVNAATYVTNVKDWLTGAYMFARMEYSDAADAQQLREIYQQSTFMTQRYGMELANDPRNNDSKLKKFATAMMGALDELAGKWMWFSAYNQYNMKRAADVGHSYTNAIEYADDITRRSVAGRGIGERPFTLTSKFVNTAAPFQLEIANTMQNLGEQFGKKNLKGLTLFALTTYAMNLGFKALFGTKKLPWDVIDMLVSAVTDGFDDDDDEEEVGVGTKALRTGRNILQGTGGMFLESIPFNSVVLGQLSQNATGILGDYAPETFGSSSLGYGTLLDTAVSAGKLAAHGLNGNWSNFDVFWTDFLENSDWLKMVLPYGGTQAQRSLKGIDAAVRGYSQKLNSDGELEAQFAVNGFFDALRSATLGKWATAGGRAYLTGETKKLTAEETAELKASDLPAKDFFAALQALKDAKKTTKNAYGETVVTSSANQYAAIRDAKPELQMTMLNRMGEKAAGAALKAVDNGVDLNTWLDYMVDYGTHDPEADEGRNAEIRNRLVADVASGKLTNEQAAYMDAAITGAKTVHDYTSPEWYELSGNESHYNMAKWANSQGIDPTLALTWYNNKSVKTLDEYGNEKSIPQEEVLKDLQRNVAQGTLTEEQAAILETMLYPDKKNKRDFSSEAAFEISASDSNYAYYKASGLDADMALRWYNFKAEKSPDSAGVMHSRKKEEVEDALAQATDMTVAQKEAAHRMMYPDGSKVPDYRSYTWYKIYKSGDSNYKKALFAVRDGAPVEAALKEIEAYSAAKAAGKTWKASDTKAFCYSLGLPKGQADALYYAMSGKTKK